MHCTPEQVRANRQEAISRLADDLAHELKNPLNAVVVNLELLRRRIQTGAVEPALERVTHIEHEVRRLHELLDPMLQLLRPSKSGEPIELDLVIARMRPIIEAKCRVARIEHAIVLDSQGTPLMVARDILQQI